MHSPGLISKKNDLNRTYQLSWKNVLLLMCLFNDTN